MLKKKLEVSFGRHVFNVFNYTIMIIAAISCLFPLINILAVSFSSSSAASANMVYFLPVDFTTQAYEFVLQRASFWRSFLVSIERVLIGIPLNLFITVTMAYPLSKSSKVFRGRTIYIVIIMISMLFSGGLVPMLITMMKLHLIDTIWALVLPCAVPTFSVILMMNFFRQTPKEIEEAAMVDGADYFNVLTRIILPISTPVIATVTLFSFIMHWNSWFDGLVFMQDVRNYPLQTFLTSVIKNTDVKSLEDVQLFKDVNNKTIEAAQLFIALVPLLLIYPFLQKYFTKGIVVGSVKG